jgi:hypothetical protein
MRAEIEIKEWIERKDRRDVDLMALAFRDDGSSVGVRLGNISYDGCQLHGAIDFTVGEKIRLVLPRMGEIKAKVCWSSAEGKAGARFVLEEIVPQERHSRLGL